jgi:hypothetical protein
MQTVNHRSSVETPSSSLAGFTNAATLKGGYVNDGLITREATDNGSSQDRERCGKSCFDGITLPSSMLNPSREGDSSVSDCQ